jgi:hypothetical protein
VSSCCGPICQLALKLPTDHTPYGSNQPTNKHASKNEPLQTLNPSSSPRGGYAHWGMLEAAQWFAENELKAVREVCDKHPGYGLLLVGHSLGAGTACLLAHWIKNVPEAM